MNKVCRLCRHLVTDDPHVCPDEEYLAERDELVHAAAEATEYIPSEELEQYLADLLNRRVRS